MLNYVQLNVMEMERTAAFYDAMLAPLGWRRQNESNASISWGLQKAAFFVNESDAVRPGWGLISFPANSIPAVRAAYEAAIAAGGESVSEPGASASMGAGHYACQVHDPDGYLVEISVSN
jgi:predicted lactoylglutathione lyase